MPDFSRRSNRLREAEPSEHRRCSFISGKWAGPPLRTWAVLLAAIHGTTTRAGLIVEAVLHPARYQTGWSVTDALMRTLNLEPHAICPAWSYTLRPPRSVTAPRTSQREVVLC